MLDREEYIKEARKYVDDCLALLQNDYILKDSAAFDLCTMMYEKAKEGLDRLTVLGPQYASYIHEVESLFDDAV